MKRKKATTLTPTTSYLIRGIPIELGRACKARAALEGKSLRQVLIEALTRYGKGVNHAAR